MKTIYWIISVFIALVSLYFYGVSVGKGECERKHLQQSEKEHNSSQQDNEDSKEKFPTGEDHFKDLQEKLCSK